MEDFLIFIFKYEDIDGDVFKISGFEEDDIGYYLIGWNIKVCVVY